MLQQLLKRLLQGPKNDLTNSPTTHFDFKTNNKGFSLGEIMIVLVIIGGIMAIVLPKIKDGSEKSEYTRCLPCK